MRIYETYAERVCDFFDMPGGTYPAKELNSAVMQLPFAEAHLELEGRKVPEVAKLGHGANLQQHVQRNFFDVVADKASPLFLKTRPILVNRYHLESMQHWREWQTLGVYLRQYDLEPALVFRNDPHTLPVDYTQQASFYLADLRVLFIGETPYRWSGKA